MLASKRKQTIAISLAVFMNVALICGVVYSVTSAFNIAKTVSFSQNIENIRTLTNASANKIELEFKHHTQVIQTLAQYVNQYNDVGMTKSEMDEYFAACYGVQDAYSWQLVDNGLNDVTPSAQGFSAYLPCTGESGFSYRVNAYQELAKLFRAADDTTLGSINYTSEFTDASPILAKASALTTTVRIRQDGGYIYKTLMLLIRSDYINRMLSSNNQIDTLSFFDYSSIIIDDEGNYVISNSRFQGTNFMDYMELYNSDFTKADVSELRESLKKDDYEGVLFYQDSRGRDCAYTIVPVHNSNWHVLSMVPISSFHSSYNFAGSFTRFALLFTALFIVDLTVVLMVNRQLRRMTKKAREANESKSLFLSSMSHDIRTPMNAIVGMTIIAEKQLDEETVDRKAIRECIKSIELSSNHLLTLINDVLDISKIESGNIVLHPSDFSIAETICETIEMSRTRIREKDFVFESHIYNVTHECVTGDSLRIEQIFINILTNAVKYTEPGGKITVELTEEASDMGAGFSRYVYRVADTGIGMTPEFVASIFDRFTRAVDTRINTVQGTGLGMAIVKQLVDTMNGTITVQSELNVGSTFTVTLDLPVVPDRLNETRYGNLPILLIDDDATLLDSVKIMLTDAGVSVDTEQDGKSGVERAVARKRDADAYKFIFVDWKLGGVSGGDVVSELRRQLGTGVHIIVMTAYNLSEIEHEARKSGADGFLTKPLFRSKLFSTIENALSGRETREKKIDEKFPNMQILVAEDNDTNWKVINKILMFYGINACRAENGKIAVDMITAAERVPDLVLMDIQMPVMNGYEAAREIRAMDNKAKASVPIYAMTADTFDDDVRKSKEAGMNGHLPKPINMQKVLEIIREHYHPVSK